MPRQQPADPPPRQHLTVAGGPFSAPQLLPHGSASLPLYGLTVLAVEDSRYACEALRLLCQRAGARLRRAETIEAARAHLRVYRPDVVIVDLGLPDGRGEGLIHDLVQSPNRPRVLLGTSGNPDGRVSALAAGANGFLDKPVESLRALCRALAPHLPDQVFPPPLAEVPPAPPDTLALRDDLFHAAEALGSAREAGDLAFIAGFLRGLARNAHDHALEQAILLAETSRDAQALLDLVNDRLALADPAFGARSAAD